MSKAPTETPPVRDRKPHKRFYGTRIRQARERSGLSQDDMAELLGLSQNSYWKLENDETRLSAETLEEIAKVLKMDAAEFLQEDYAKYRIKQVNHDQVVNPIAFQHNFEPERKVWEELSNAHKREVAAKDETIAAKDEVIAAKEETSLALNKLNTAQQETIHALRLALGRE